MNSSIVIIPTYNEIDNIENMILKLGNDIQDFDVLIVDDMSPDGTAQKVEELQAKFSQLHLIKRRGKKGLGPAYIEGFKWALDKHKYQYICEMDCDFSHDPNDLALLRDKCVDYDLVIGSRYINGIRIMNWPFKRLLLSYLASVYIRFITGLNLADPTGGFKCFRRDTLLQLPLDSIFSVGYSFQLEINYRIYKNNNKILEVPIVFYERAEGKSKMRFKIIFEALWAVFRLRLGLYK